MGDFKRVTISPLLFSLFPTCLFSHFPFWFFSGSLTPTFELLQLSFPATAKTWPHSSPQLATVQVRQRLSLLGTSSRWPLAENNRTARQCEVTSTSTTSSQTRVRQHSVTLPRDAFIFRVMWKYVRRSQAV